MKKPKEVHTFYPRVVNKTNIIFMNNEINLLEKGPKYNLHSHKNNWLITAALEAETAITFPPTSDCDCYRQQVTNSIENSTIIPSLTNTHTLKSEP
jgi:hypothetical protein